jgi:hypothetical protein
VKVCQITRSFAEAPLFWAKGFDLRKRCLMGPVRVMLISLLDVGVEHVLLDGSADAGSAFIRATTADIWPRDMQPDWLAV